MFKLRLVMARVRCVVLCSAGTKNFEQYLARLPCPVKCQKCQFTYWRRVVGKLILEIRKTWHQSAFKAKETTKLSLEYVHRRRNWWFGLAMIDFFWKWDKFLICNLSQFWVWKTLSNQKRAETVFSLESASVSNILQVWNWELISD